MNNLVQNVRMLQATQALLDRITSDKDVNPETVELLMDAVEYHYDLIEKTERDTGAEFREIGDIMKEIKFILDR